MQQECGNATRLFQANEGSRYVPSMSALRVACRTPWGDKCDLLVLQGHVIVPRQLGHIRAPWWLGDEHHPRLSVTSLGVLERRAGTEVGISPYCVPIERWNEVARNESWLPVIPATPGSFVQRSDVTVLQTSRQFESLRLPRPASRRGSLELDGNGRRGAVGDRLRAGSHAVSSLVGGFRRLVGVGALAAAVLACAYYLAGATPWLWNLRQGMTDAKIQEGFVLIAAGLFRSAFTGLFKERLATPQVVRAVPYRSDRRTLQPLFCTVLDGYRLGISLQLLAFGAFAIF